MKRDKNVKMVKASGNMSQLKNVASGAEYYFPNGEIYSNSGHTGGI
jgi:hypothetical protein